MIEEMLVTYALMVGPMEVFSGYDFESMEECEEAHDALMETDDIYELAMCVPVLQEY